jgi:hypothetical protein
MAQKTVQLIIGRILTDEELRDSFLEHPIETLASLHEGGCDLTAIELDALAGTDRRLWRTGAMWVDPRLQRCRLSAAPADRRR